MSVGFRVNSIEVEEMSGSSFLISTGLISEKTGFEFAYVYDVETDNNVVMPVELVPGDVQEVAEVLDQIHTFCCQSERGISACDAAIALGVY
jgi:hypothetical protein